MKKRLLGLVALTLCALLALAPASAALAQWFYDSDYTPAYMLRLGDLIDAGTTVYSSFESGRDHDLKYYNGVGDLEDDPDKKVTIDPESSVKLAEAGTLAGFENGMWSCMNEWQVTTGLERFGKIVHTVDLPDNQLLVVSSGLQTADGSDMSEKEPEYRKQMLEAEAYAWDPEAKVDFYQMAVYQDNTPVQGVMRPVTSDNSGHYELDAPVTVTLPYPEGWNQSNADADSFVLIHGWIGPVENSDSYHFYTKRISVTPVAEGLQAQVRSFSPYGLAYKEKSTVIPIPTKEPTPIPGTTPEPSANVPTTGDNTQLAMWFLLAALSLAGAAILIRRKHA